MITLHSFVLTSCAINGIIEIYSFMDMLLGNMERRQKE